VQWLGTATVDSTRRAMAGRSGISPSKRSSLQVGACRLSLLYKDEDEQARRTTLEKLWRWVVSCFTSLEQNDRPCLNQGRTSEKGHLRAVGFDNLFALRELPCGV
jgi:hypothetical protein